MYVRGVHLWRGIQKDQDDSLWKPTYDFELIMLYVSMMCML